MALAVARALRPGPAAPDGAARLRRRLLVEHAALAVLLLSGVALAAAHGYSAFHPRWLAVKVGLTLFLVLPLAALHAFVAHGWMRIALRKAHTPAGRRLLERAWGLEQMLRTLAVPLLGVALPLLFWLSFRRPR